MESRDKIAIYLLLAVIFLFADLEEEGVRRSGWISSHLCSSSRYEEICIIFVRIKRKRHMYWLRKNSKVWKTSEKRRSRLLADKIRFVNFRFEPFVRQDERI